MQITINQLLNIQTLYEKVSKQNMSISLAYHFNKLFQNIEKELKFYQVKIKELMDQYGEKDTDGSFKMTPEKDRVLIQPEYIQEFQQKMVELLELNVDIEPVTFSCKELESLTLSMEDIGKLMPFIKE